MIATTFTSFSCYCIINVVHLHVYPYVLINMYCLLDKAGMFCVSVFKNCSSRLFRSEIIDMSVINVKTKD